MSSTEDSFDPLHDSPSSKSEQPQQQQNKKKPNNASADEKEMSEVPTSISSPKSTTSTSSSSAGEEKSSKVARKAYAERDVEASRIEHEKAEPHGQTSGDLVKAVVFGGLDGIMTIFAVVTAAAGGGNSWQVVLVFGLARLVAGAWAMGFGEFLGGMAEFTQAETEYAREKWEYENCFEEEKLELKLIYMKRGYPEDDAQGLVDIIAKNKDHFLDAMMKDELDLSVDLDDWWGPIKNGAGMFISFCFFGCIPLFPYFSGDNTAGGTDRLFVTSCALVGVSLIILGCLKGYLTDRPMPQMAINMIIAGVVSGTVSYLISSVVDVMIG